MASTSEPTVPSTSPSPEPFISMVTIPKWLITHPELRKRGITLERPLQPFTVYATDCDFDRPSRVVKAINPSRQEIPMYDLFDQLSGSPISRHTIPHEIVLCERPLLIMPHASHISEIYTPTTSSVLAAFDQILEGVEHLHRLRIAHMDIFQPNVVAATEDDAKRFPQLIAGRVYLIDFESCQQFEQGPGVQTAVQLPNTHVRPPLGMKSFDPYGATALKAH
uniref:Lmo1883 protein n=1 Tax=Ganoderma boninense TaxID=34458 RepID=A0A5K1JSQ2_9APHY|nr:Lmo1883 protein [Ganoderma boninense]